MSAKLKNEVPPRTKVASAMLVGEMGTVAEGSHTGAIVLKIYDGLIDLNNPHNSWGEYCSLMIDLLPEGTEVVVTAQSRP